VDCIASAAAATDQNGMRSPSEQSAQQRQTTLGVVLGQLWLVGYEYLIDNESYFAGDGGYAAARTSAVTDLRA